MNQGKFRTTKQEPYTMKTIGEDNAEIVLYGDIVSERPSDWYGKPIEGQYILLSAFLEDLKRVENVTHLTVRIHSVGGNAYDAIVIHNRLKSMKADVTVIVDGIAMSGGSIIMCAGNTVQVYPGSLVMIHKCWASLYGGYNATELRRIADSNDAVDRSQAAIYQTKTGITMEALFEMMEQETYMTGQEAIDKGFADTLAEGNSLAIAADADRRTLYVGTLPVWVSNRTDGIPNVIPTVIPTVTADQSEVLETDVIRAAVREEQERIKEIDAMSALFDSETVQSAKFGTNACSAQEMTFRAAQKAAMQGKKFMSDLEDDTRASGSAEVRAASSRAGSETEEENLSPAQRIAKGRADAKSLNGEKELN